MIALYLGYALIVIGLIIIAIGIYGLYRYEEFHTRIAIVSLIDTSGFILCIIGMIVLKGLSLFSLKLLVILIFTFILSPLANHIILRGAHTSGYHPHKE